MQQVSQRLAALLLPSSSSSSSTAQPSLSSLPSPFAEPLLAPVLASSIADSAAAASASFRPAAHSNASAQRTWANWAGTVRFVPSFFHAPRTIEDIRAVLAFAREQGHRVRVVGFGHSPGSIVDASPVKNATPSSAGKSSAAAAAAPIPIHLLALAIHFRALVSLDLAKKQVTVQSGMSLEALNALLDGHGLALSSLGSISDQSVGGALSCGTHGSSTGAHAVLAASVVALEILTASGEIVRCSRAENSDLFDAARVGLGCLGVLTNVTLQAEPAYDLVEQSVAITFEDLVSPQKFQSMIQDPQSDFLRFHWIPHTDKVVYTRMQKVYGAPQKRDSVLRASAAKQSALVGYLHRLQDWKGRMVGFHALQALYFVSTLPGMDRVMVPRIARLYSRIVFPPASDKPFPSTTPALTPSNSSASSVASTAASTAAVTLPSATPAFTRRDRHDRVLNFDCLFAQYVTEWAVDLDRTPQALRNIRDYIAQNEFQVHFPIEIRFSGGARPRPNDIPSAAGPNGVVGGDGIWLSPCYSSAQAWIGIIMYRPYGHDVAFEDYFRGFEMMLNDTPIPKGIRPTEQAAKNVATSSKKQSAAAAVTGAPRTATAFNGKPHWAKNVVMPLELLDLPRLYPRWEDFRAMRERMDPTHMFSNAYVHALFDQEETSRGQQASAQLPSRL